MKLDVISKVKHTENIEPATKKTCTGPFKTHRKKHVHSDFIQVLSD